MGVRTISVTSAECDLCSKSIVEGELWVDYGECGVAFHWSCLRSRSALDFIKIAHEGGDQMFVDNKLARHDYNNELKHLHWEGNENRLANLLKSS